MNCWAEAPIKIARMTLTIKLDGNWSSFQLANNTPPLSVTGSVIAPSARISALVQGSPHNKSTRSNPVLSSAAATGVAFAALPSNSAAGQASGPEETCIATRRTQTLTDREAGRETEREQKADRQANRKK